MTYHGIHIQSKQIHTPRYLPGIGTIPGCTRPILVESHLYSCNCGREFRFEEQAEEPFYCPDCQVPVSVEVSAV